MAYVQNSPAADYHFTSCPLPFYLILRKPLSERTNSMRKIILEDVAPFDFQDVIFKGIAIAQLSRMTGLKPKAIKSAVEAGYLPVRYHFVMQLALDTIIAERGEKVKAALDRFERRQEKKESLAIRQAKTQKQIMRQIAHMQMQDRLDRMARKFAKKAKGLQK